MAHERAVGHLWAKPSPESDDKDESAPPFMGEIPRRTNEIAPEPWDEVTEKVDVDDRNSIATTGPEIAVPAKNHARR